MNRKILFQVTAPAIVTGLLLVGTCLVSGWSIHRLQRKLSSILSENVASLQAALDLEIRTRQLRYHSLLYLNKPTALVHDQIEADEKAFEEALTVARGASKTPQERTYLDRIEAGYSHYRDEMTRLREEVARTGPRSDFLQLAGTHPIQHIIQPCQDLWRVNREHLEENARESDRVSWQTQLVLLLLGLGGPVGGLLCGYGIVRELTRSMVRAEQLAALGQLAAGVAHEVRNPLMGMKLLVESALRSRNRKPLTEEDLQVIYSEITRLEETVKNFLTFARLPAPERHVCDLRTVVDHSADLVRARARQQGVELAIEAPGQPLPVDLDAGQFQTVLVNLFLNALDAMPRGGRLEVGLAGEAQAVRMRVCDTGAGIPAEMLPRLFTPFASSKPTGTGLGLSLSRRIVEEHGGRISASNREEGGACFTVTLPRNS
jgi:signal transduction histidine kinase